ncbi:MAG TPA: phosphodiester glycosidase family protein [Pyrinomonadaceae bacterium]
MVTDSGGYVLSDWIPIYPAIDYASGGAVYAFDISPPLVRIQHVNMLRIHLSEPGLRFYTTPTGGEYQTVGDTITGFLTNNPDLRVAINASLSWYDEDRVGGNFSLFGLCISKGEVVCDPSLPAPQPPRPILPLPDVPDNTYVGAAALVISQDNAAMIQVVTAANPLPSPLPDPARYYTSVAGSAQPIGGGPYNYDWPPQLPVPGPLVLVEFGQQFGTPYENPPEKVAGRTAVGLSATQPGELTREYLYLVTIDGREDSSPQYGAGFYDLGFWLLQAGAGIGINLDGGGSTAMARSDLDEFGNPVVTLINVPYGDEKTPGFERAVGQFFGVAPPLYRV